MWLRRAALSYTLPYAKPGYDPERILTWRATYAPDSAWFIQEAIGWGLRELGKHDPQRVVQFLTAHWHTLRSVAWKEVVSL
jgi:3-methyladenine DNA glycosylase AlkD